jgi:hypothetical protein
LYCVKLAKLPDPQNPPQPRDVPPSILEVMLEVNRQDTPPATLSFGGNSLGDQYKKV